MIVKNEASVISRCLESVKPLISYWIIVDTGSTDETKKIISDCMKGLPGAIFQRPWVNFAHNRSEALALSKSHCDYSFVIDADDVLEQSNDLTIEKLDADVYSVDIIDGDFRYPRSQFFKNSINWVYKGVVHEFPYSNEAQSSCHLPLVIHRENGGDRRKDSNVFLNDAKAIENALITEQDTQMVNRYVFYLAQSFRDAGYLLEAIENYQKRSLMGGWVEEVYYSLLQIAKLKERLNCNQDEVIQSYKEACSSPTTRAEAHYYGSRYCRINKEYKIGYAFAKEGLKIPNPNNSLFGEPWIYETGLLDEFSVNAFWIGRFDESLDACLQVLEKGRFKGEEYDRVVRNARYSLSNLLKS